MSASKPFRFRGCWGVSMILAHERHSLPLPQTNLPKLVSKLNLRFLYIISWWQYLQTMADNRLKSWSIWSEFVFAGRPEHSPSYSPAARRTPRLGPFWRRRASAADWVILTVHIAALKMLKPDLTGLKCCEIDKPLWFNQIGILQN